MSAGTPEESQANKGRQMRPGHHLSGREEILKEVAVTVWTGTTATLGDWLEAPGGEEAAAAAWIRPPAATTKEIYKCDYYYDVLPL